VRHPLSGRAAIVGIGATEFSKDSGRSELRLAAECVRAALDDAGLKPSEVDGLVSFTMDTSTEAAVAREVGIGELSFFSRIHYGGGAACATVQQAAMAVATGIADVVVCYRAFNERSGHRFGQVSTTLASAPTSSGVDASWSYPMGLSTPAAFVAMTARRYMHAYGATSEDFGAVAVADRKHAASNPNAFFYGKPITMDDHQASRWIAEPLHLLDCCQESDGGVAVVVTSAERARDLRHRPAIVRGAAQGSGVDQYVMTSYFRDGLTGLPEMGIVGQQLFQQAGVLPEDVQVAILYDHFTPFVLIQLEELGFCARGEAPSFIADGAIELGGRLPINTHGGQIGEAYIHGMNGIAEAARQLRRTSVNQVDDVEHVLVTAGTGVPTSGLLLST
jgi:acetyl-CoA acetyltransferase